MVVFIVIICNIFVLRLTIVYGSSMEPTLKQHDFVLIWQLGYSPGIGDIIVTNSHNPLGQCIIKRVIAVGGQKVCICQGQVYVDGTLLGEEYLEETDIKTYDMPEIVVPDGQVFLLGDNRLQSKDSRTIGCVPVENIMGKVIVRLFPFKVWR